MGAVRNRLRWILVGFLCFLVAGFLLWKPLFIAAAEYLDVGERPREADFIFLLAGDYHSRPPVAAELYAGGFADQIVISRVAQSPATAMGVVPSETDYTIEILEHLGVPRPAIVVLTDSSGVDSTRGEAAHLRSYLERHPARRVLVVTSMFHTRRVRWLLRRAMPDSETEFIMISVQDPRFTARNWWESEAGMLMYFEEYLKFVHNFLVQL